MVNRRLNMVLSRHEILRSRLDSSSGVTADNLSLVLTILWQLFGTPAHEHNTWTDSPQLCFWWMIDRSLWRILILTRTGDYKPLPLRTKSLLTPLPDLFHFLSQLVPILCRAGGGATHWGEVVIICMDWFMVTHFSDFESYNEQLLCRGK